MPDYRDNPLDHEVNTELMRVCKCVIPYLDPGLQKNVAVGIKFLELINTMNAFSDLGSFNTNQSLTRQGHWDQDLLRSIRSNLSPDKAYMIDALIKLQEFKSIIHTKDMSPAPHPVHADVHSPINPHTDSFFGGGTPSGSSASSAYNPFGYAPPPSSNDTDAELNESDADLFKTTDSEYADSEYNSSEYSDSGYNPSGHDNVGANSSGYTNSGYSNTPHNTANYRPSEGNSSSSTQMPPPFGNLFNFGNGPNPSSSNNGNPFTHNTTSPTGGSGPSPANLLQMLSPLLDDNQRQMLNLFSTFLGPK